MVTFETPDGHKISFIPHQDFDGPHEAPIEIPEPNKGKFDFDLLPPYVIGNGKNFGQIILITDTYIHPGSVVALDEDGTPLVHIKSCTGKRDFFEIIYVCKANVMSNDPNIRIEGTAVKAKYLYSSQL